MEKAREPKESNIAGKKVKRERLPRKISFYVGTSVETGPVSYIKTFQKDDVIDPKLRWKPKGTKVSGDKHNLGHNFNVKLQQSRLQVLKEAGKDGDRGGSSSGSGDGRGVDSGSSVSLLGVAYATSSSNAGSGASGGGGGKKAPSKRDGGKSSERKSLLGVAVPKRGGGGGSFKSSSKSAGHTPGRAIKAGGRR